MAGRWLTGVRSILFVCVAYGVMDMVYVTQPQPTDNLRVGGKWS